MATPLRDLLHTARTDAGVRSEIARSPGEYLADHGWEHLEAADLREAMLILADGTPSAEAITWTAGVEAIDAMPGEAASDVLLGALGAMDAPPVAEDPATLDALDIDTPDIDSPDIDSPDIDALAAAPDTSDAAADLDDLDPDAGWEDGDQRHGEPDVDDVETEPHPSDAGVDELAGPADDPLPDLFDEQRVVEQHVDEQHVAPESADDWDELF